MVELVFDKFWDDHGERYGKALGDQNAYTTGVIGEHNVVLTYMPGIGSNSAAVVAAGLRSSYRGIEITFVVGICGAVPYHVSTKEEIILGDCIISTAVVQYDFGRQYPDGFIRKNSVEDSLGRANLEVRSLTAMLMTRRNRRRLTERLAYHLDTLQNLESDIKYPGTGRDRLFESSYIHKHRGEVKTCNMCLIGSTTCLKDCDAIDCGDSSLVIRKRLSRLTESVKVSPMVHFGRFASANTVMKSGLDRDLLAQDGGVIAFEMEGSGVWDSFATIVVKSACDYADSHKSKEWQAYAAATAAAGLKALLEKWEMSEDTFGSGQYFCQYISLKLTYKVFPEQNPGNKNRETTAATISYREGSPKISVGENRRQEHVEIVQQSEDPEKESQRILLEQAASYEEYWYREAETCYQQLLIIRERVFGPRHLETLWVLDKLGHVCSQQIMYEKAEAFYKTSLQAKEETLGPNHESTLATVHSLGVLLKDRDKFVEAETMSLRALRGREQILGLQNISTLDTVDSLGVLYMILDRFEESERMFLRALHDKEKTLGPQSPATLDTVSHLGNMYLYLARYGEAEKMCIRALQGREEILGPQHRQTLHAVCDLGNVYGDQRRSSQANAMLIRASQGQEILFEPQNVMTMDFDYKLGCLYYREFKEEKARILLEKVLQSRESILGRKHTLVLAVLLYQARVYEAQGNFLEAEELLLEILQSYNEVFGMKHTQTLRTVRELARTYRLQRHFQKAEEMFVQVMQGFEETVGPKSGFTLDAARAFGLVYYVQNKLDEAENIYMRAFQGYTETLGAKHGLTLESIIDLADVYHKKFDLNRAESLYLQAIQGFEETPGGNTESEKYASRKLAAVRTMLADKAKVLGQK